LAFLEIENLDAFYGKARSLSDVSMNIEEGKIIGIIGPNGAGKSTLLDSIMGLTDCSGRISFDGKDLCPLSPAQIVSLGIGYAPERGNLFAHMNVLENLLVGAYRKRSEITKNLEMVFRLFPRLQERRNQEAITQSGGEQRMLSLGRALMSSPRLLLVDEPTIGLAPVVCSAINNVLKDLNEKMGLTIVITEQNVNFTLTLAQEIYLMETGSIKMRGNPDELKQEKYVRETYFGMS
jgi:branched-chain amino acid transport system ATP-binding protein|tara:strand:- start:3656 stop:4363 length:708 start_codon:yes stop_codon:yes gene_type:complete